jgi:tetratricopeptide (TPR) repeat protein
MVKPERNQNQQIQGFSWAKIVTVSYSNRLIRSLATILLLSLLVIAIYSNTFSFTFHFDDESNITKNPWIKNLSNSLYFSGSRYVGFLSFALNYHFGQLHVFGYHLVNLLIHIANGCLVYLLVRLLFRAAHSPIVNRYSLNVNRDPVSNHSAGGGSQLVALVTALLFVAHPIQTQAVTYIVQRFASLATLFYLLTAVFYLHGRLSPPKTRSRYLGYAGALIATILAMKTKENTFTLPFMLLLIEVVFFRPLTQKNWIRLIPFFLTLPIIPLSRPGALGEGEAGFARDITDITRLDYLFTQFRVIVTYLRLLVFPVHQNLDYDYPVYHSLLDPPVFLSFLFLLALLCLALYLLLSSRLTPPASRPLTPSASRLTAFGILWFFLTLSIESSIIPIRDVIFEHRLYLPSVGFFLAACVAAFGFSDRGRLWKAMGIGGIVVVLSVATYQRNKIWQDDLTLWNDVVLKSPQKARGFNNLGKAYFEQGMLSEAQETLNEAIRLNPGFAEAHLNLGNVYKNLERINDAQQEYKTALSLNPKLPEAHNNLGVILESLGRFDEAIGEYRTALSLKPDYAEVHNNLGLIYRKMGRLEEAVREYQLVLELDKDNVETQNNLGVAYSQLGRLEEAVQKFKTILSLKPDYAEVHNNLGNVYQKQGRLDEAIREYQTATAIKPDYSQAYFNLGVVHYEQGKKSEALAALEEAIHLKPDYAEAHNNLGDIHKDLGHLEEAVQEFQIALQLKPDLAEAYYNLGQTYQRMGKTREAIHALEQALRIKPDYDKARRALNSLRQ